VTIDLEQQHGTMYIAVEDLKTPSPEDYIHGVRVVTCNLRRDNPKAKLTSFIAQADKVRQEFNSDIHEALIVDEDGFILEGLSRNFFGIRKGVLYTAKDVVLSGITRALVLDEALKDGINVEFSPIHLNEISLLDGAFLTSASRGVLPIHSINNHVIGDGKPDRITRRLSYLYEQRICQEVEEI
jgi:branched-chain amino acid aminotransferase